MNEVPIVAIDKPSVRLLDLVRAAGSMKEIEKDGCEVSAIYVAGGRVVAFGLTKDGETSILDYE